jgi:thiamine transport system substrate-binding protein
VRIRRVTTGISISTARSTASSITVAVAALALAGCSALGGDDDNAASDSAGGEVVLVTHDSFALPDELVRQFEEESGYTLVHSPAGDGGELTNKLVLTKSDPLGDVAFGVDNTYASRAVEEGVFADYAADLPAGAEEHTLPGEDADVLTPIDTGNVCVNVDTAWFEQQDLEPPATLDDLTKPAYRGLFVTPGATSSTPGNAFLLATIAAYGGDWPSYWEDLLANDAKIVRGWEDAYNVDFTFSGGERPIVVSYDSSPAFTVTGDTTSTAALPETCVAQVEYAGVVEGSDNPEGAEAVIDWLLSPEVQAALPSSMYVYPVADDVELPEDWAEFAPPMSAVLEVPPAQITANRKAWLEEWTEVTTQ